MIPLCERHGISQIVWSPLAQGVLTGKYRPGEQVPAGLARRDAGHEPLHRAVAKRTHAGRGADRLRPVAEEAGLTMAQLALAWVLRQGNVAAAIVGASRPEQVHENVARGGRDLSADTLRRDRRRARGRSRR